MLKYTLYILKLKFFLAKATDVPTYVEYGYYEHELLKQIYNESAAVKKTFNMFGGIPESIEIKCKNELLEEMLGPAKYKNEELLTENTVGVVNGLAYTSVGGDVLKIDTRTGEYLSRA